MKKLKSVLLVDDSDATNELTSFHLRRLKLCDEIYVKKNGKEALLFLQEKKISPDLILLDINMPVMNGFEFLEAYSKLELSSKDSIIIVLLTSSSNPSDISSAQENSWVKGYFQKPLEKATILKIIETHFEGTT